MRMRIMLLSVVILGLFYSRCGLAVLPAIPQQKLDSKVIKAPETIPPKAEQARNKARDAQRLVVMAVRKATKAGENARNATTSGNPVKRGYYAVTTDNQGYHYEGGWLDKPSNDRGYNGYGVLSWPNGNRYAGEFLKGHKHGYGVFTGGNGDSYQGEFHAGEVEGYGRYVYIDGNRYEGELHHNFRRGYGVMIYANGERYEGEWLDNEKNGYGVMSGFDGTVEYAGFWRAGLLSDQK